MGDLLVDPDEKKEGIHVGIVRIVIPNMFEHPGIEDETIGSRGDYWIQRWELWTVSL
jgi:hypothetical protein